MSDYIEKGTVLDLVKRPGVPGEIEIFVKPNFMTNTIKLTVERNDLIRNVKAKIEEKEGLIAEFQELRLLIGIWRMTIACAITVYRERM